MTFRIILVGFFLIVLVVGIVLVSGTNSPDCVDNTVIVHGFPYQVSTCR